MPTQSENIINLKRKMREAQLRLRAAVTLTQRLESSRKMSELFIGNIPLEPDDKIGSFHPMSTEIDVTLLTEIIMDSHICALPCIDKKDAPLTFRHYTKKTQLKKDPQFNIFEPEESSPKITPTVIIVPLLAFDKKGYRLGFGGGFYDRTIELLKNESGLLLVGVAYDFQQVSIIPRDEYDQKLDCVVTDKKIVICE